MLVLKDNRDLFMRSFDIMIYFSFICYKIDLETFKMNVIIFTEENEQTAAKAATMRMLGHSARPSGCSTAQPQLQN